MNVLGTRAHFVCKYLHNISIVNTHISWYCWVEIWWEHLPGTIWQSNSQNRREKRIGAMTNAPKSSLICSLWIQYSHKTVVTLYKYVTVLLLRFTTISENITNKFYTFSRITMVSFDIFLFSFFLFLCFCGRLYHSRHTSQIEEMLFSANTLNNTFTWAMLWFFGFNL